MPAIQPARLKIQISQLVEKFKSPISFVAALKDLYDFYSDRTQKSGRGLPMYSLTHSFILPIQVTRQIEIKLQPIAVAEPQMALAVADVLWSETWLECRALALSILGWIPPNPPESIVDRIKNWGEQYKNDPSLSSSLAKALVNLWKEAPESFLGLLDYWFKASDTASRTLGLRVIPSLVSDPNFPYIPRVYNLLTPFVQRVSLVPDSDLVAAIRTLAQNSPKETAYYLRRNLTLSENVGVFALIRQSLDAFPPPVRKDLQAFLHHQREEFGAH